MAKRTRALSGASKDAFFKRLMEDEPLDAKASDRVVKSLQASVSRVRIRLDVKKRATTLSAAEASTPETKETDEPFDPFSPKVIILLRTDGREAVLSALANITSVEQLLLLAKEQQLTVAVAEDCDAAALREAIVSAAERRLANRRAAAR